MLALRLASRRWLASKTTPVSEISICRPFSAVPAPAPAADDDDDLVLSTFKEQQHQYRSLLDGMKKLQPPLSGDEAAIKKYADQMEALRKQVGLPTYAEMTEAVLDYKLRAAGYNVRSFVISALESREDDSDEASAVTEELMAALDAVEEQSGPLTPDNKGALQALVKRVTEIESKHHLPKASDAKNNKEVMYQLYKDQLEALKAKAQEDMDAVKRKDGLDYVETRPEELKLAPL